MLGSPANVECVLEIDNPPPGVATSASVAEVCSSPVHNATCPPVTSVTGNPAPNACGTRTTSRLPVYTAVEPYTNFARTSNTTEVRVGRLGSAANTASVSNDPNRVDSDVPVATVAGVSCQAVVPWRRHCTPPVTDTAPAFGAPTAETVTAPWVVTVEAGAVSDGAPYPNAYTPVAEAIPPGDFAYASTRCPPGAPPTVTVVASVLAVIWVNDTLCHDPPSIRNHTLVGAEVAFPASKRAVIVHDSAAWTVSDQDPSPLTHAMVGVRGVANAVRNSTAGPHPDQDLPS